MKSTQKNDDLLSAIKANPIFYIIFIALILIGTILFFVLPPGWFVLKFLYDLYIAKSIFGKIVFYFLVLFYTITVLTFPAEFIKDNL